MMDNFFEVALELAQAAPEPFVPKTASFSPETTRYSNVFVSGHSNGGVLMQTEKLFSAAAGFIYLAAVKLYQQAHFNDMAQVAGAVPSMFLTGELDTVTEPT